MPVYTLISLAYASTRYHVVAHRLLIHNRKWMPTRDTQGAKQNECLKVAMILKVKPILSDHFTRDMFVQELQTSTVLHIG